MPRWRGPDLCAMDADRPPEKILDRNVVFHRYTPNKQEVTHLPLNHPCKKRLGIRIPRPAVVGALACMVVFGMLFPAAAHGAVGEMTVLKGRATVVRGKSTIVVRRRLVLESGDRVSTGPRSKVQLRYFPPMQGSVFIATSNTVFVVREPRRRKRSTWLRLVWGAIRSRVTRFSRRRPYMRTGTAVIGVKGTDFIVYVKRKNASEFIGVDGLIEAVSRSRPEYSIRIGKRQWGESVKGEKPKPPIRVPDALWFTALREFSFPGETPPVPPPVAPTAAQ